MSTEKKIDELNGRIDILECEKEEIQLDLNMAELKNKAISLLLEIQSYNKLEEIVENLKHWSEEEVKHSKCKADAYNVKKIAENMNKYHLNKDLHDFSIYAYEMAFQSKEPEKAIEGLISNDYIKSRKLEKLEERK